MNKSLPDKWIRKAIFDAINNITVDGVQVPCYDSRILDETKDYYILLTTQTNEVINDNKCEKRWQSSILIDVVTIYNGIGNTGSRLFADNILDAVRNATNDLTLDVSSGLVKEWQRESFPNDIILSLENKNVYRKLMRIEMQIN